jgi:hypothetical protein
MNAHGGQEKETLLHKREAPSAKKNSALFSSSIKFESDLPNVN